MYDISVCNEGAYEITDAAFQQLEVDYFLGDPDPRVHETKLAEVPILRMYGVSEAGKVQIPAPNLTDLHSSGLTMTDQAHIDLPHSEELQLRLNSAIRTDLLSVTF